jgi:hypothetical protein
MMREKDLLVKKKNTDSNHPYPVYPNLIKDLKVFTDQSGLGRRYHVHPDRNRLRILGGLAGFVLPEGHRLPISRNIDAALSLEALRMAVQNRNPPP